MNKKFSTLMAGLMLASAFSVNAANPVEKYEANKGYRLQILSSGAPTGRNGDVIAVVSNPESPMYGQLIQVSESSLTDINAVKAATWDIVFSEPTDGTVPKFTYINKATGLTLSVDPNADGDNAVIKGGVSEWLNSSVLEKDGGIEAEALRSFYEANKVVYLTSGSRTLGQNLFKESKTAVSTYYTPLIVGVNETADATTTLTCVSIAPAKANAFNLNADALNSQLGKLDLNVVSSDQAWFNLYFDKDVTDGAEKNLFAATPLNAKQVYMHTKSVGGTYLDLNSEIVSGDSRVVPSSYVRLIAKDMDNAYITVDTTFYTGSENQKVLPKFTYAKKSYEGTNNVARLDESSYFAFAYDSYNDRVLIKSCAYYQYKTNADGTPIEITGADGNTAYTSWGDADKDLKINNAYIRLAQLSSVRELTVADYNSAALAFDLTASTNVNNPDNLDKGMLTNVTLSQKSQTFSPATIADGLYMIKLHTSGYDKDGNKRSEANGDYLIASLAGNFGYAEQAKNQNYDHMPAAQWYVKQNGSSSTSPISIQNREFFDQFGAIGSPYFAAKGSSIQAFSAGDGKIFFMGGAFANDTLEFIPVSDASKADSKLGYKYVDEKQASVETYYFNYLSGLALDKGLNTPSTKDSLVRVDETGEKIALRLVPVTKDDSYGIQLDEKKTGIANLVRNAYYIQAYDDVKFAADGRKRYLSYEPSSKKYVMSLVPTAFFLKENNDIDGTHYYALVDANLYGKAYSDKDWNTVLKNGTTPTALLESMYPAAYKGMNIGTDADKVWSYVELATEGDDKNVSLNGVNVKVANPLTPAQRELVKVIFYDKDGEPIVSDASEAVDLYAYMATADSPVITLKRVTNGTTPTVYYAMNPDDDLNQGSIATTATLAAPNSTNYAESRISVDDNTLDLFKADLDNQTWENELRVSAFETEVNDSPLYRRFNGANGEFGTADNAPLNLKFYRYNNDQEYLFENYSSENKYRDGITDKEISFLGVNNAMQFAENETRSYTMFVDTAYVRENTCMPQYLIGVRPEVVLGDTTWCNATSAHHHETLADSLACDHTVIDAGFTRAMYLFNAQDSVDVKNYDYQGKVAYGAQGYTRLAFKDAVHAQDTLYILKPGVTTEQLKATNLKDGSLFANKIALNNNKHKNVVFQFRLVAEDNNRFLIESESDPEMIAPEKGGWVKIQNGVPVIARFDTFNEAIAQAEIFDVNDEIKYDATANDEVAVEAVKVIAGNGQVTIMGAAGKNVTITNILGKVIASQVIASDNATIAVPAGIVAVAVEGEAAVKAIVK